MTLFLAFLPSTKAPWLKMRLGNIGLKRVTRAVKMGWPVTPKKYNGDGGGIKASFDERDDI
ncbi:uncharacterized protein G2W53_009678 [Senna tora]|uniref:Uncharacterized protein n=1 Tax=Senna tora TaxID=362788 RepID=A0A834WYD2_9FABA|nr:uncharacterized protein G2W53_009678 [Senna tora]